MFEYTCNRRVWVAMSLPAWCSSGGNLRRCRQQCSTDQHIYAQIGFTLRSSPMNPMTGERDAFALDLTGFVGDTIEGVPILQQPMDNEGTRLQRAVPADSKGLLRLRWTGVLRARFPALYCMYIAALMTCCGAGDSWKFSFLDQSTMHATK